MQLLWLLGGLSGIVLEVVLAVLTILVGLGM
jgi:hypothetical protein